MAVIRRHKYQMVMTSMILVLLVAAFWLSPQGTPEATASDEPAAREIDIATYTGVSLLRRELCLTNRDMAAMGCTQAGAEAILGALVDWYEVNRATLEERERQEGEAQRALRKAMREVNVGPRNEALMREVPSLVQASAEAASRRREMIATAAGTIEPRLTSEQAHVWATARANRALPVRYRYLTGLDERQSKELLSALSQRGRDSRRTLESFEQLGLTTSQRSALVVAEGRISQRMADVQRAVDTVLPVPKELQEVDVAFEHEEE